MLASLRTTRDNVRGPLSMHRVLAAIHQGNKKRLAMTLLYGRHAGRSGLYIKYPRELRSLIEKQIQGEYPGVDLDLTVGDKALDFPSDLQVWCRSLWLRPDLFPLVRYSQWEEGSTREFSDPLVAIMEALAPDDRERVLPRVELRLEPVRAGRRRWARRALRRLARPDMQADNTRAGWFAWLVSSRWLCLRQMGWAWGFRWSGGVGPTATGELTQSPGRTHERERALQAASGKVGDFLFAAQLRLYVAAPVGHRRSAQQKLQELAGVLAASALPQWATFHVSRIRRMRSCRMWGTAMRRLWPFGKRGFLLSAEEVATLFHPATRSVGARGMHVSQFRKLEPPDELPIASKEEEVLRLGRVLFRSERQAFGIRTVDRRRHCYLLGKTGVGKTSLLQNMLVADIHAGRGVGLIDPHGDLAESVLASLPRKRWEDLVLFDPADTTYPIAFNPLDCGGLDPMQRVLRADALLSVFKKLYANSFQAAARMEDIFRNAFLALVEDPESTLMSLSDLLHDETYRNGLARRLENPVVREFWIEKFPLWTKRYHSEAVAPVENKVRGLTSNPILQGILGQSTSKLDLRQMMDQGRILIANLSKGNIGENSSHLLGSLLVTMTQQAAMSRADVPEPERRDFFLYVDEFQNVVTESFAAILSEARKYRLSLTLAHQFLSQLEQADRTILPAIFGNVGTLISFSVGPEDAQLLCQMLGEQVQPSDLVHLPKFHAYIALMIDGKTCDPFLMTTSRPPDPSLSVKSLQTVRAISRAKYCRPASNSPARETVATGA